MNILIAYNTLIPVTKYGGTERVVWDLGKELHKMGHKVTYLVAKGSTCDFAKVIFYDSTKKLAEVIPSDIDICHFQLEPTEPINKPYLVTIHGNSNNTNEVFPINTIFVSRDHAKRYGSLSFIHNGLSWDAYQKPDLNNERKYFHFLGLAAWRIKNLKGAIDVIKGTKKEKLKVLGGNRLNIKMGFRLTLSPRISFCGMVGGQEKDALLQGSKGLVFPVKWNEPFGLALIESLYFGCPVFGTPYGSLPEIVNAEVGVLSNSSKTLTKEVENAGRFSKVRCHEYARDVFNSKKMAEKYIEKYHLVLNGKTLNQVAPRLISQTEKFLEWK
jgi:glycosyltransferase involved in cell wall biosynthesis